MTPSNEIAELNRFLKAIGEAEFPPPGSIWRRWWAWKLLHPLVEIQMYALAMQAKRRGLANYGVSPLWEVLRWHLTVEKTEEFKCANAYRSRYARYLMWKHPDDLGGFFHIADLRTD